MKRVLLHVAFWTCYFIFGMSIDYYSISQLLPELDQQVRWKGVLLLLAGSDLIEMVFVYYLLYIGYERLVSRNIYRIRAIMEILLCLAIAMCLIRFYSYYLLNNFVFNKVWANGKLFTIDNLWLSSMYLGLSGGTALSLRLYRKQLKAAQHEKKLIEEKSKIELQLLRNQLNPHFLFNTLNNIYALARKKADVTAEAILKLSELLDFMLYRAKEETLPLYKEVSFLNNYISLEKMRYDDRLNLVFIKEIENDSIEIPSLLLLPLVENAFKHGVSESRFHSRINIELKQHLNVFSFVIENDFDDQQGRFFQGQVGLENIKKRLSLLYKDYKLTVSSQHNIFKVFLVINLDSYGKI